jgi:hypothetical protein
MRFLSRLAATLAAAVLMLAVAAVMLAGRVQALSGVEMSGSATPAAVHGPATVVFKYTITVPVAIESTSFTTHQAAALPASATGATLDGRPVPAAQITQPNAVDITIQIGAAPTDGLAAGVHTITFNASAGGGPAVETSSSATLSWVQASVPATLNSPAVAVAVNQPDIAVTHLAAANNLNPFGGPPPIGTGMEVQFDVDVANLGFGTPQTTLTISLPAGLVLDFAIRDVDADGGPPLSCTEITKAPPQYACALGRLPHVTDIFDPGIQIFVTTTADPPVGTVATMTVSAAPDAGEGTDTNMANNSASTPVKFTGLAALQATVTPTATKIHVGSQTTVRLTIHNAGPQPAEQTNAFVEVLGSGNKSAKTACCAFDITGFTGHIDFPGNGGPPQVFPTSDLTWFVGTLAPGATITAILTVEARAAGTSQIQLTPASTAGDPRCPNDICGTATAVIQAVPASPAPTPSPPHTATTAPPPRVVPLAATGLPSLPLLALSVLLLVTGTTLTLAARRRNRRRT